MLSVFSLLYGEFGLIRKPCASLSSGGMITGEIRIF
jgi:hypothetical protein